MESDNGIVMLAYKFTVVLISCYSITSPCASLIFTLCRSGLIWSFYSKKFLFYKRAVGINDVLLFLNVIMIYGKSYVSCMSSKSPS